jgi:uncharacterized protein
MSNSETRRIAASERLEKIRVKSESFSPNTRCGCRFAADVMLGRLAKWLRIAGFDVLYSNRFSDDELISISNREERILLSRDTRLLVRKSVQNFIYLQSENTQDQLKQVLIAIGQTHFPSLLTRCLSCNEALIDTPRESAQNQVPSFVFKTQRHFKSCPKCGKIFWAGTHRNAVLRTLESLGCSLNISYIL